MGQRSADPGDDQGFFRAPWETTDLEQEQTLRRFRKQEGLPVLNFKQLVDLNPRHEEVYIFTTVYDRFSAGWKPGGAPESRP